MSMTADSRFVGSRRLVQAAEPSSRQIGAVWGLLVFNVMGSQGDILPKAISQALTMAALVLAFSLAAFYNQQFRVRPNAYLFLLMFLTVVSVVSSLELEVGIGSLFRCARLVVFVITLWLLSRWWGGDLKFAYFHLRAVSVVVLSILVGMVIFPAKSFSYSDSRLTGVLWGIPPTQVGMYCALCIGLSTILWIAHELDGRSLLLVVAPSAAMLLLSHTRTALFALTVGLGLAVLSLARVRPRAWKLVCGAVGLGIPLALVFSGPIMTWLQRGQDASQLSNLTGRALVWDRLLNEYKTPGDELLGIGLTDGSFGGLPIDNGWLAIYYNQGLVGMAIIAVMLLCFLALILLRPPTPERACAIFLVIYCIAVSYTEVGLGGPSPYHLSLAAAASMLVRKFRAEDPPSASVPGLRR